MQKLNIVYEYLKQKSFHEPQTSFPKCIEHQIFLDTLLQPLRVFEYHLTIRSLTSRKRYAQKRSRCGTGMFNKEDVTVYSKYIKIFKY